MSKDRYILFAAQEANFQTRSMLIPYDLIMGCEERAKDLSILREHSLKNVSMGGYIIDNLLIQVIKWEGNCGRHVESPTSKITQQLMSYADGMDEGQVFQLYDLPWASHIIIGVASNGFNHVENYCNFRNNKGNEIVEGFLVLERDEAI
jgi:hypothetical protein